MKTISNLIRDQCSCLAMPLYHFSKNFYEVHFYFTSQHSPRPILLRKHHEICVLWMKINSCSQARHVRSRSITYPCMLILYRHSSHNSKLYRMNKAQNWPIMASTRIYIFHKEIKVQVKILRRTSFMWSSLASSSRKKLRYFTGIST